MKSQPSPTNIHQYKAQLFIELLIVAILLAFFCIFLPQLKAASLTVKIMVAMVVVFWIMRAALTLNKLIDGFKEKFVRR
jgi:hypothetical protein